VYIADFNNRIEVFDSSYNYLGTIDKNSFRDLNYNFGLPIDVKTSDKKAYVRFTDQPGIWVFSLSNITNPITNSDTQIITSSDTSSTPSTGVISDTNKVVNNKSYCNGCLLNDTCLPIGYRQGNEYCSGNSNLTLQKNAEETCDNNFECSSNVCVSGKCVSEGLIQKILNWFKKLFGGK